MNAGGSSFVLTIHGSAFVPSSTAFWGTTPLPTQFVSSSQLTAQVNSSQIASAGTTSITVQSTVPGGRTSNAALFEVDPVGSSPATFINATATVVPGSIASYPVKLPSSATNVMVSCLNMPSGATCSYAASTGALNIATSPATPSGTYQVTAVFTETLPAASMAWMVAPILLIAFSP